MSGPMRRRQAIGPDRPECSGRLSVVKAQEPADALAADDRPGPRGISWLDEPPVEALAVALGVLSRVTPPPRPAAQWWQLPPPSS
jgi:hypothetical protein